MRSASRASFEKGAGFKTRKDDSGEGDDGGTFLKRATRHKLLSKWKRRNSQNGEHVLAIAGGDGGGTGGSLPSALLRLSPKVASKVKRWKQKSYVSANCYRRMAAHLALVGESAGDVVGLVGQHFFAALMLIVDEGIFEVFLLVAVPVYAGMLYVHRLLAAREHAQRHVAHAAAENATLATPETWRELRAPPAPPTAPFWVEDTVDRGFDLALSHPIPFLLCVFGLAVAVGIFYLFLNDITECARRIKLAAARKRTQRDALYGYEALDADDDVEGPSRPSPRRSRRSQRTRAALALHPCRTLSAPVARRPSPVARRPSPVARRPSHCRRTRERRSPVTRAVGWARVRLRGGASERHAACNGQAPASGTQRATGRRQRTYG